MLWKPWRILESNHNSELYADMQNRLIHFSNKNNLKIKAAQLIMVLSLLVGTLLAAFTPVLADGPMIPGYLLQDDERVPAPTGYVHMTVISGKAEPYGLFSAPQDLFLDSATGNLLVADTGNNRIVILDHDGNYLMEIGGEGAGLKGPEGVFVDPGGRIWVADRGNGRVVVFEPDGSFSLELTKPDTSYLDNIVFSPSKVVVDKRGFVYTVIGSQSNLGIVVQDGTGRFRGFFGRTRIRFNLARTLARFVATETQRKRMLRIQPAPLSNLHIDSRGFIYAISPILPKDQIQRLNSVGTNVYGEVGTRTGAGVLWDKLLDREGIAFGETETRWEWNDAMRMSVPAQLNPQFLDVAVDEFGIVSVIDSRNNQIYQYDQAGNLVSIFGGSGGSEGFFYRPISIIAAEEGLLYVLDSGRGDIQVLRPTDITQMIHRASYEYFYGDYEKAAELWGEISERNTNFALAHTGLGKALMAQQRYREAMDEYFYAENKDAYSNAFYEYRLVRMRANFHWIGIGVISMLGVLGLGWNPAMERFRRGLKQLQRQKERLGLRAIPILMALAILSWMISLSVLSYHFTTRRPEEIQLLYESGKFIIPWVTWCVSAYGVGEIFYGKGTFRNILVNSAWALWPLIVLPIPVNLLTNILSLSEKTIYNSLNYAIWALFVWQFLLVIKETHQFELGQAVKVMLLTLVGMVFTWILCGLAYALTNEIFRFIGQLVLEIYVRLY
jgi:DNA-binding beta-propeller fold protein YncE